jgi:lipopolysaccharide/colanic/teichoic acid biosynthesis glycosyltransferase
MNAPQVTSAIASSTHLLRMPSHFTMLQAEDILFAYQKLLFTVQTPAKIIFDFTDTEAIDGSAIGVLTRCLRLAESRRITLALWSIQPKIYESLVMSGLDQQFEIQHASPAIAQEMIRPLAQRMGCTHPSVRSRSKRVLDIAGALVGLSVTAVLLVPLAIAIRLDSPGPILFSQVRCGLMGRRFRIWKFRTMVVNAERLKSTVKNESQGAFFKNANDPRITRVGRFLRKTSLDELPQFWNVLTGDMSLVGTRPPVPQEVEQYEPTDWQRLDVKPGMTGEWQVHGRSQIQDFQQVVSLDLRYQHRWSLKYDLKLIVKTLGVILKKDTAC